MNNIGNKNIKLTKGQESLWAGEKLCPDTSLRNVIYTFEIQGELKVSGFKKAFQKVIDNAEALRTVFTEKNDGTPVQAVLPFMQYDIKVVDLPKNIHEEDAEIWLQEQGKIKLDISKCIFNSFLLKIHNTKYVWLLNMHHLVTDTVSVKIIYDLTSQYYQNIVQFDTDEIDEIPSLDEYLIYEKDQQLNPKNDNSKDFWVEKIEKTNTIAELYGKNNKISTNASTRISWEMDADRSNKLKELAQNPEIRSFTFDLTLFNIFSSLLFVFLHKVSGQSNLVIGTTNQNRTTNTFKKTIGYFIQIFPTTAEIAEDDTFVTLLNRTKLATYDYLKHIKSGLVTPEINRSYNVVLNFINMVFQDFAEFPTTTNWLHSDFIDSSHLFHFHITDFNNTGRFNLHLDLNNEVFTVEQLQLVKQHFLKIIDAFVANKDMKLSELSLITTTEIQKIETWNDTNVSINENETLLTKFEAQVKNSPNTTALVYGEEIYTYNDLNEKANQVAHFLIQEGVKTNDVIAISLERSFEMMVYIYGILKAGAAYLPIDSDIPTERLKFIADDAAFKIVFYNHSKFISKTLINVVSFHVNDIENKIYTLSTQNPELVNSSKDLAYIIYTSGSTGEPKGVKCHHKGICNRLNWMNRDYPIDQNDTLLQKTPITFDVSLWELFWPLQIGAKLVLELPEGHKNPDQLVETIIKNSVSVIHFVPSMLNVFINADNLSDCISLKNIFCSGEKLSVSTVDQTYKALNYINIYNLYGPTEASVDVTSWHCKKNSLDTEIPIGYPVSNTKIYIVDQQLNLVPIGVKGEIYIGGVQVATGYLNRDELTGEKFINDIFSSEPEAKIYKTGDVGRYRFDGAIEYLGRTDNQIKLRGIRIELGEIEKAIEKFYNISQVVVVIDKKENLVAYSVEKSIQDFQLKNKIITVLPDYMIPTHFIHLKELPLTKNGKVDRSVIQKINIAPSKIETSFVAAKGEIEELIVNIWKEVLQLERIGVHDNFISLGGHSLAAIRITARINEEAEMKFPLNKIFELPTIAQYAKYIEQTIIAFMEQQK